MVEEVKLTKTEKWIFNYLMGKSWCSPTQIGHAYGEEFGLSNCHSSWASPKCKSLVNKCLLDRNEKGHYRICV